MNQKLHVLSKTIGILSLLLFVNNSVSAQYCTPAYGSSQCNNYNMFIDAFSTTGGVANITNTSTGCGNSSNSYIYYSTKEHRGIQGTVVNFSATIGSSYPQGVRVWVDYNIDGDFDDAGENVYIPSGTTNAGGTVNASFTIPANATPGDSRLRVRCSYSETAFGPCDTRNYGECEDYKFVILPSCSAKFILDPLNALNCEGDTVLFEVMRTASQSVRWQMNTGPGWVNMVEGGAYKGTTTDSLRILGTTISMQNYQFRAVATNTTENCSVNGNPAKLTLIPSSKASIIVTSSSDTNICDHQEVVFQTSFTNGGVTPQYRWMLNGKQLQGQVNASLKIDTLKDDDYVQCLFISSGQCVSPMLSLPITYNVVSQLLPEVNITVADNFDGTHTFTAHPFNEGPNPQYYWYVNGKMQVGANGADFVATELKPWDKVTVGLVSSLTCAEPKYVTSSYKTTGVAQLTSGDIGLFPNPNRGEFTVSLKDVNTDELTLTVTNAVGQVVYNTQVIAKGNRVSHRIQLQGAPAGIYMLSIRGGDASENLKFTITD